ncbi:MAG: ATP-grasp domain-containing protein [Deltaproteobacteria bacterium]|nr:ATP-grasp domain-containing protein [Deltaproteobacteria bacterium]
MAVKLHNHKIKKLLIANRGEIALRIQRACRNLSIPTATTVSEADLTSFFAKESQEIAAITGLSAKDTYLNIDKIIQAASDHGCNAIHPGYGFLSENYQFAEAVRRAGLIFVGPNPECMKAMGSKLSARQIAFEAGVPCTPGSPPQPMSDKELHKAAAHIGFPIIIKAALGGGGRGMRVVNDAKELEAALPLARTEALKNFSSDSVYLERYIPHPRHVEVQILGDRNGNIIHLGTRECSVQRRHQKLVEEAPAPGLSKETREKLHQAALRVAKAVKYDSAGTAEFLVCGKEFYFLEMNTRIQVEHPVTEEVTGVDLVELQIRIAQGEKLPLRQEQIKFRGHSIEFRIYAEDPVDNFRPHTGEIESIALPNSSGCRVEAGFSVGDRVSPYYDALLAKLIVNGESREQVIDNARAVLAEFSLKGLPTTANFHRWLLNRPEYISNSIDIGFLDREYSEQFAAQVASFNEIDPAHRLLADPCLHVELIKYITRSSQEVVIEISHRKDGTFLARPVSLAASSGQEALMRRSNRRDAALQSLIDEVLERQQIDALSG